MLTPAHHAWTTELTRTSCQGLHALALTRVITVVLSGSSVSIKGVVGIMSARETSRERRRLASVAALAVSAVCVVGTVLGVPAYAGPTIASMPKENAVNYTPRIVDDKVVNEAGVRDLRQVSGTMYAGGAIHKVLNAKRTHTYKRHNLFSFDPGTGHVTGWTPNANGDVYALEPSADHRYLYIGGDFDTFDGTPANHLVRDDLQQSRVDTGFSFPVKTNRVSDLQLVGGRLFVSGNFAGGIVAVDPTSGAPLSYLDNVQATGNQSGYSTRVYRFAINPAQTRMVVIGSFTAVGGQPRQQVAMVDLGAVPSVSSWYSPLWDQTCSATWSWYSQDVDWSPDGSTFAVVTTGGPSPAVKLCDSASLWRPTEAPNQQPLWVNHSGGDTFHSVSVTNRAVFVSGHFRWLDNPAGHDSAGPGAKAREGIGAIDPSTGKAMAWNPFKSIEGGKGGYRLYFTGRGLWVGDFEKCLGTGPHGHELHEGLGLLPF